MVRGLVNVLLIGCISVHIMMEQRMIAHLLVTLSVLSTIANELSSSS